LKTGNRGSNIAYGTRDDKKPENLKSSLGQLWKLVNLDIKYFILLFLATIITSLTSLYLPLILGRAVDKIGLNMGEKSFKVFRLLIIGLGLTYILEAVFKVLNELIIVKISQIVVYRIRKISFNKLQKLPITYFYRETKGEVMSRISNDIEDISTSISQALADLISSILSLVGSLIIMFSLSLSLASLSLITMPMTYFLARFITRKTRILFRERQKLLGELNSQMEESISGIETIKAFNRQEEFLRNFKDKNQKFKRVSIRAQILSGAMMPLMNVLKNLNFTIIAVVGGYLATKNIITVGVITSFIAYSRQFSRPLNEIASSFNVLQSGIAGAERIMEVLDEEEEDLNLGSQLMGEHILGGVEFRDVDFSYKEGERVLKGINFKVEPGENIALVGETGAGKTTIINLLTGFFTSYTGEILIDGRDIKDYNQKSLRDIFGVVLQDTYLFSGSIRDNIRYGNLDASGEEILRASKLSRAYDFIRLLPQGLDTVLTEAGRNLSPGERQLIAISRAIIKEPRILILDEATSSIDTKTEKLIQEAMVNIMENRTTFIIAHRLSTIVNADKILVLDKGEIKEQGKHRELLAKKGLYYELYRSQRQ